MNRYDARHDQEQSTKVALLHRAEALFTEFGYTKTSIDEIVKHEQMTKGAFYYYFKDKKAILEQVVDALLAKMVAEITSAIELKDDPWERVRTALETYLNNCLQPSYHRIVLQEAPAILGWATWREKEKFSVMSLSNILLEELMNEGKIPRQRLHMISYIFFGAITEAAIGIAEADHAAEAREQAKWILEQVLASLLNQQLS